jgi:hypothetical protein
MGSKKKRLIMKKTTKLFDIMSKDATTRPKFLDSKNLEHRAIHNCLASAIIELTPITKPIILNMKQLMDIWFNFEFCFDVINTECKDLLIFWKIEDYMEGLIDKWLTIAVEEEEYEIAENINTIKNLYGKKKILVK